jgi:hypothetical protein
MDITQLLLIPIIILRSLAKGAQVNSGAKLIAAVIFLSFLIRAQADLCAKGSQEIDGNWFCQPVTAIRYSNVGTPGAYVRCPLFGTLCISLNCTILAKSMLICPET